MQYPGSNQGQGQNQNPSYSQTYQQSAGYGQSYGQGAYQQPSYQQPDYRQAAYQQAYGYPRRLASVGGRHPMMLVGFILAIVSMVIGMASLFIGNSTVMLIMIIFAFLASIASLVLSLLGMNRSEGSRSMGIEGLILSNISLVLTTFMLVIFIVAASRGIRLF